MRKKDKVNLYKENYTEILDWCGRILDSENINDIHRHIKKY